MLGNSASGLGDTAVRGQALFSLKATLGAELALLSELEDTELELTELDDCELELTELDDIELELVEFDDAELTLTELDDTELELTGLDDSELELTELDDTELELTELEDTELELTELDEMELWEDPVVSTDRVLLAVRSLLLPADPPLPPPQAVRAVKKHIMLMGFSESIAYILACCLV